MTQSPRPGPHLMDVLRRLRARPVSSWRVGDREASARTVLQRLADLAADGAGRERMAVPDLGVTALADQLSVLLAEARSAGVPESELDSVLDGLAGALSLGGS